MAQIQPFGDGGDRTHKPHLSDILRVVRSRRPHCKFGMTDINEKKKKTVLEIYLLVHFIANFMFRANFQSLVFVVIIYLRWLVLKKQAMWVLAVGGWR